LAVSLSDNRRRWVMQRDGSYEQLSPDGEPVRDTQRILMDATEAALDADDGSGIAVDTDLVENGLLVEAHSEAEGGAGTGADSDSEPGRASETNDDPEAESDGSDDDTTRSDGGDSVFDTHAEHWYRPDSETYGWAVRTADGERRYFKTRGGARNRLRSEYE
jgi:polyphosphate kinase